MILESMRADGLPVTGYAKAVTGAIIEIRCHHICGAVKMLFLGRE
jgi:hypothetical protein